MYISPSDIQHTRIHTIDNLHAASRAWVEATERLSDMVRAVDMGAMGFVPKRSSNHELYEALALVLALMAGGVVWSLWIPALPDVTDADATPSGTRGIWQALAAHPVVMVAGLVGGFFESGVSSLLPLYGLALGLGPAGAALLVSASGLGSAVLMLPAGLLADRMAFHPSQRWGTQVQARHTLMRACAGLTLAATAAVPWVAAQPVLAWPVVFVWGGAGGCLYTLAMIDIGSRETGLALVNGTAVLVMAYTLGGVLAPALGAWALDASATVGFPALMLAMATAGVLALNQHRKNW